VGNSPLVDYRYALSGSQYDPVDLGAYLPGVSQTDRTTDTTHYLHNDHLGSTWYLSGDDVTTMYRGRCGPGSASTLWGPGAARIRVTAMPGRGATRSTTWMPTVRATASRTTG
jgi:hypothetical protein